MNSNMQLDKRFRSIAWGALFILVGVLSLVPGDRTRAGNSRWRAHPVGPQSGALAERNSHERLHRRTWRRRIHRRGTRPFPLAAGFEFPHRASPDPAHRRRSLLPVAGAHPG